MKVVALVSGGKDSCYNMLECVRHGHEVVALANLRPCAMRLWPLHACMRSCSCMHAVHFEETEEIDSFMFQTVGHSVIELIAECMRVPLFRASIRGSAVSQELQYRQQHGDEVEDLYLLLRHIKVSAMSLRSRQGSLASVPAAHAGGGGGGQRRHPVHLPAHARGACVGARGSVRRSEAHGLITAAAALGWG